MANLIDNARGGMDMGRKCHLNRQGGKGVFCLMRLISVTECVKDVVQMGIQIRMTKKTKYQMLPVVYEHRPWKQAKNFLTITLFALI